MLEHTLLDFSGCGRYVAQGKPPRHHEAQQNQRSFLATLPDYLPQ